MSQTKKIIVVGAGVSGLVAAIELEKSGHQVTILDANKEVGGRIQTDADAGFLFDRGFQVLLTHYPLAKEYLDYDALELKYFKAGAYIFSQGKRYSIGDPQRDIRELIPSLFAPVGTLKDKLLIRKLGKFVEKKTVEEVFESDSQTTLAFLQNFGFSPKIIHEFFKPFFAGIFLENELQTSAQMFLFVFKMFSKGSAAIPTAGIQAIPKQLAAKLKHSEIKLNQRVVEVNGKELLMSSGESLSADVILWAAFPYGILPGFDAEGSFRMVTNLYYSCNEKVLEKRLIALVPDQDKLINNFCYINSVSPAYAQEGQQLLSVSINGDHALETGFLDRIKEELSELLGLKISTLHYQKGYRIKKALPTFREMRYSQATHLYKVGEGLYLAGDYLLNPSLNAAMHSGQKAATAIIQDLAK